jgi:hypothetical protein
LIFQTPLSARTEHRFSTSLSKSAEFISDQQCNNGAIPWFDGHFADPWDHIEAAMGLSVAGKLEQAKKAYTWLASVQEPDGSWFSEYNKDHNGLYCADKSTLKQTHHCAYIATGLWHYFLCTGDSEFIADLYPAVEKAFAFVLPLQTQHGEFNWAVGPDHVIHEDALVTACSSILKSLACAVLLATLVDKPAHRFMTSHQQLKTTLAHKPERFDRTWPAKTRFSMDWFYPIFCGALSKEQSKLSIQNRWSEFVVDGKGCKCVNDEPWVTTAETCELIFALLTLGETQSAEQLFHPLLELQDYSDGGFWTGIVTRDNSLWPKEKTTWTAGALLLAADALFQFSRASHIFTR